MSAEARIRFYIVLNDIRIIDYFDTLKICREYGEEEESTIRKLVAWRNREWTRVLV